MTRDPIDLVYLLDSTSPVFSLKEINLPPVQSMRRVQVWVEAHYDGWLFEALYS
ncbi:MAG: hypothetical protein AAGI69_24425 [Cyanobacteria bacterium P01_H01_bin.21]